MPDDPLIDKVPPHSLEAEMAVLGAMMLSPEAIGLCVQYLADDAFYRAEHRTLFATLVDLYDASQPVDLVTMKEALAQAGHLEAVGGEDYLVTLADSTPTIANAEYYARVVKEKALLRGLINAAAEIIRDAHTPGDPIDTVLDRCEQRIFEVVERKIVGQAADLRSILTEVMQKIELVGGSGITGLPTGFMDLDDKTRGLQAGEFIVLAARPSVGKSALALNIAEHIAVNLNRGVAFFSLEMSKEELALRLISSRAEVDGQALRKGKVSTEKARFILDDVVNSVLKDAPLYIDDSAALRIIDLRAKARRLLARRNIELIIVDYLQLMTSPGAESRQVEVSNISRGLKALARELGVPVLAVAQLRRESEEHKRPRLSDLRESGAIEQDADVVLLLHRESMRHTPGSAEHTQHAGTAELIIAKQRNGPTDMLRLTWQREFTRFRTWSPREAAAGYPMEQYTVAGPAAPPDDADDGAEPPF
ncbi:MAG: replicative DNA helicase [Planctomycetes bacterium]|nr:replicative DNA helicase [Planctomycetota bacterium]